MAAQTACARCSRVMSHCTKKCRQRSSTAVALASTPSSPESSDHKHAPQASPASRTPTSTSPISIPAPPMPLSAEWMFNAEEERQMEELYRLCVNVDAFWTWNSTSSERSCGRAICCPNAGLHYMTFSTTEMMAVAAAEGVASHTGEPEPIMEEVD